MKNEARFWSYVEKTDSCWLWIGGKNPSGYGCYRVGKKTRKAHRISYELLRGPIPGDMFLDHICHVRACINPSHLRTTTFKLNQENRDGANRNNKSSGVLGVSRSGSLWRGCVGHNKTRYYTESFKTIEEADAATRALRLELFTYNEADKRAA